MTASLFNFQFAIFNLLFAIFSMVSSVKNFFHSFVCVFKNSCIFAKKNMIKILTILISIIVIIGEIFTLNPVREYSYTPDDFGLNYEEVTITTDDNLNLRGWLFFPNTTSYRMVIISHDGNGNMSKMIEIASQFTSIGFNVLTYDYRGFGQSDDFQINTDFYIYAQFEKDLNAAIDYVRRYHSKNRNVNLYGKGIGASLSLSIGAVRCDQISKIIADSPYLTLEDVKSAIKTHHNREVLLPLGFNKLMLEPKHALASKGGSLHGMLIIAGDKEPVYNVKTAREIANIRSKISSIYVVKGATFDTTFSTDKNEYFSRIKSFL